MGIVKHVRADADAQELVRHVAGDLRRPAQPIEIALTGLENIAGGAVEGRKVQDCKGFFKGLHGGAKHLLHDLPGGVIHRNLGMQRGGVGPVAIGQTLPEIPKAAEAELLGHLDHHRFGHAGPGGDLFQRCRLVDVLAVKDRGGDRAFKGRQAWQPHPDLRAHGPWITHCLLPLARRRLVDQHRDDDDDPGGEQLVESLHIQQRQPVAQRAEDDAADQRPDDRPPAAHLPESVGQYAAAPDAKALMRVAKRRPSIRFSPLNFTNVTKVVKRQAV